MRPGTHWLQMRIVVRHLANKVKNLLKISQEPFVTNVAGGFWFSLGWEILASII